MSRDRFAEDRIEDLRIWRLPRFRALLRRLDVVGVIRYLRFFLGRRHDGYDAVVFSFFYLKYIPLIVLLRGRGRALLVIAHGGEVMPGGFGRAMLKRIMFRLVDVVTPVSDFTETIFSCLVRRRQRDNDRIITIYNGVDAAKLRPKGTRAGTRRRLGIDGDAFVVLSVGNLVRRKGIDIVVRAVEQLVAEGRRVHHVVVGRGPERAALGVLAVAGGNASRFTFVDSVEKDDLADVYAAADLFALVSITDWDHGQVEGFGITYAEAMAMGLPVIGGGGSGTATPVKHGFTGVLVDPYADAVVDDVADAIRMFMDDPNLRERMGAAAARHVAECFSWTGNALRTRAAIERVLAHKTGGV